jgi:nonsense-mediated mRNA decay protein 3
MTSRLKGKFCPKCGRPSDEEGLCGKCRISGIRWFECAPKVTTVNCPGCGARRIGNTWADSGTERDVILREAAVSAVKFHPDVRHSSVTMTRLRDISSNRALAMLEITGTMYGKEMNGDCRVEIAWQKEQCDRCSRISGSYYEGVVQVRAHGRQPTEAELRRAVRIAYDVEDAMQEGGERLSYVSDVNETREGLDIVVGSQHIGQAIAQAIVQQMGGRFTTHPKLIGEKDGRQIFRVTYSLRLPRFQRGDVVRAAGRYGEVVYSDAQQVRLFDLADGTVRNVKEDDVERLVGNVRNAAEAMVAYADGDVLGILDPETGVTTECIAGPRIHALAGERIRLLRDRDRLVLIR